MRDAILILLLVLVVGGTLWLKDREVQEAKARIVVLEKDLATATDNVAQWQVVALAQGTATSAQAALGDACLKREAKAQEEAAAIDGMMAGAITREILPDEKNKGVDDATRQRAADFLNRAL